MHSETQVLGTSDPIKERLLSSIQNVFKVVVSATRAANQLPKLGDNFELYSTFTIFNELMQLEAGRSLKLMMAVLRQAGVRMNLPALADDQLDRLIDCNDTLLERIGNALDEAAGIRKKQQEMVVANVQTVSIETSWNRKRTNAPLSHWAKSNINGHLDGDGPSVSVRLMGSRNVPRPQLKFKNEIDNSNRPFLSKLRQKHNAKSPARSNVTIVIDQEAITMENDPDMAVSTHPYKYELDRYEPTARQLMSTEPMKPKSLHETQCTYVQAPSELAQLCELLKCQTEFAVDLEHHSYRSFLGLTCLMQISTRDQDFLVDCLELWRNMHILNEPFSDPHIVKVFHGADADVLWLQRDFGIYVVNLFDTGHAMRALAFPKFSLAYLLKHYLDVTANKQFQLADWRIRPLPEEMVTYAREDTHYLLYCYDMLKKDLLDRSDEQQHALRAVLQQGRDLCLKEYEKPLLACDDHIHLLKKSRKLFNVRQEHALQQLIAWRDRIARLEDESLHYVLPNHMLLHIAEILPREPHGILACCNPVPPLVKQELQELHRIVRAVRDLPLTTEKSVETPLFPKRELHPLLHCPHDLSHIVDDEANVVLTERLEGVSGLLKDKAALALWCAETERGDSGKIGQHVYSPATPYELYLLAKMLHDKRQQEGSEDSGTNTENADKVFVASVLDNAVEEEFVVDTDPEPAAPAPLAQADASLRKKKRRDRHRNRKRKANDAISVDEQPVAKTKPVPFDYSQARMRDVVKRPGGPVDVFDPRRTRAKAPMKGKGAKKGKMNKHAGKNSMSFKSKGKTKRLA